MPGPLLETKLHIPRRRHGLVPRPRLNERLNRGAEAKLLLVSAPAGFGKTTLLGEWLAAPATDRAAAWLSLDQSDNDPATFWTYLVRALRSVAPESNPNPGASVLALLDSARPPPIEIILAALLNELSAMPTDLVLVLDDYHVIDSREVQDGMVFLLDHLPPQLHLVIASRADPALPLARLRARGELAEVRVADLRFTPEEAARYLGEGMGLHLTAEEVAALEARTEGWIAALQLAALSMQGRADVAGFVARFTGDDRYIVDYLVEEVLQRQPEHVRRFLLQTSILDRLSGPLCDAVTGQESGVGLGVGVGVGKAMLEGLERSNLFVVPLDDRRQWYRYHHLFADVLRARLLDERPNDVPDLHRRASTWYERNGEPSNAVRHALAADDFHRAADLLEPAAPALLRSRQETILLGWLKTLPEEVLRCRPVLSNAYAGAMLSTGERDGIEVRLRDAERWLNRTSEDTRSAGMVVVDEAEFRRLPGAIAVHRAGHALVLGNVAETVSHAQRALALVAEDDHLRRGSAAALLALAAWTSGNLESAHESYATAQASLRRAGNISDILGCALAQADIRIAQGRLREAMRTYEQALQLATAAGAPILRGAADMHVGMAELYRERDERQAATQHLLRCHELGEHMGLPQNRYRLRVAMARMRETEGDLDGALDLLDEAQRVYMGDFSPNVRPIAALKARLLVAQGRCDEARDWVREQGLSLADDLSYLHEFEHITMARVLLACARRDVASPSVLEVLAQLERLLTAAEDGDRRRSVIEILVLQALALQRQRADATAALVPLERALTLAEPEGHVRIFVDEGPPMATLLAAAAKREIVPNYVRRLLSGFGKADDRTPVKQSGIEPLSQRELDVLRLLGTDLDGPEIARELTVSLSTVRTHTRNIYSKLGVSNRRAAARRAEELDLLSRTHKN